MFLRLHEEIKDFHGYISPNEEEINMKNDVVRRIMDVVKQIWPKAKVSIVRSRKSGSNVKYFHTF